MSEIGTFMIGLASLAFVGLLAFYLFSRKQSATTAGEQARDKTDDIEDDTRERIEDAPDTPNADTAHKYDDRVRDLADQTGTDAGDGFQPERVQPDSGELLDPWGDTND